VPIAKALELGRKRPTLFVADNGNVALVTTADAALLFASAAVSSTDSCSPDTNAMTRQATAAPISIRRHRLGRASSPNDTSS